MVQDKHQMGLMTVTFVQQVLFIIIAFFISLTLAAPVYAAPGDLDATFDTDGIVTTDISGNKDEANSIAIQSDGKIVVAGRTDTGSDFDVAVVRYNSDGSLDTSFGGDGIVSTPIGGSSDSGQSVVIQPDGKIVVAGYYNNGADNDFFVARYNSDGSLDTSFDGDGIAITPIGSSDDRGYSVALQSDGKIVMAGRTNNGGFFDFAVVRFNSDGSLDTSFDGDGIVTTPIGGTNDIPRSVAVQSDGKIVVGGYSHNGADDDFAAVRYNSDGSLDTSFDSDGIVTTAIGSGEDDGYAVAIQPDGKIVVGGSTDNGSDTDFAVVRYNSDGSLDTSFDGDGIATTEIGGYGDYVYALALQPDGKIMAAGFAGNGSEVDFAVARYNKDGSLDTTFGANGTVTTDIAGGENGFFGVVVQSDGKILGAGSSEVGSAVDIALVRYDGDTAPTLTTADVSSITSNSAVCGGEVTGDGSTGLGDIINADVTARGVCWSTSANPTTADSTTDDGSGLGAFTSNMTGLTPNTTYYVRAYATNFVGTTYGTEQTFTTTEDTGGGGGGGGGGGCFTGAVFHRP